MKIIRTTLPKAKELEKICGTINYSSKDQQFIIKRLAFSRLRDREIVVNYLVNLVLDIINERWVY